MWIYRAVLLPDIRFHSHSSIKLAKFRWKWEEKKIIITPLCPSVHSMFMSNHLCSFSSINRWNNLYSNFQTFCDRKTKLNLNTREKKIDMNNHISFDLVKHWRFFFFCRNTKICFFFSFLGAKTRMTMVILCIAMMFIRTAAVTFNEGGLFFRSFIRNCKSIMTINLSYFTCLNLQAKWFSNKKFFDGIFLPNSSIEFSQSISNKINNLWRRKLHSTLAILCLYLCTFCQIFSVECQNEMSKT